VKRSRLLDSPVKSEAYCLFNALKCFERLGKGGKFISHTETHTHRDVTFSCCIDRAPKQRCLLGLRFDLLLTPFLKVWVYRETTAI